MSVNNKNKGFYSSSKPNGVALSSSTSSVRQYSCNGFSRLIKSGSTKICTGKKYYSIPLKITPSIERNNIYMVYTIASTDSSLNKVLVEDALENNDFINIEINETTLLCLVKYSPEGSLIWYTYIENVSIDNIKVDNVGNVYLTGRHTAEFIYTNIFIYNASGINSPTPKYTLEANSKLILIKYDSNGNCVWVNRLGENDETTGICIALDFNNNIYLTGYMNSGLTNGDLSFNIYDVSMNSTAEFDSFKIVNPSPAYELRPPGVNMAHYNGFLVKYNSSGISQWGTYFGGKDKDFGFGLDIDTDNNIYLTGYMDSGNPDGDLSFNIYDASMTQIGDKFNNFKIVNPSPAYQLKPPGVNMADDNGFLLKYDSNGISQWGTYFGGKGEDWGFRVALDSDKNIYISGYMDSGENGDSSFNIYDASMTQIGDKFEDFKIVNPSPAYQLKPPSDKTKKKNGFLLKYNSSGKNQWGTYFGGMNDDKAYHVILDDLNNIYLAGFTDSDENGDSSFNIYDASMTQIGDKFEDFKIVNPSPAYQLKSPGDKTEKENGFLLKYDSSGINQWGTYFGGNNNDIVHGIALDSNKNIYITGTTGTTDDNAPDNVVNDTSFNIYDASMASLLDNDGFHIVTPQRNNSFNYNTNMYYMLKYNSEGKNQLGSIVAKTSGILENIKITIGK